MIPSNYAKDFFKLPKPAAHEQWAKEFKNMARHTQRRDAEGLIKKRRPNEPEDIQAYRMENFEHITSQAIIRAINNLQRFFSQTKATVKTDQETKEYFAEAMFNGTSFDTYVNQKVLNRMIDDPNGYLVWWPEGVGDQTKKVEPRPLLVLSTDVRHEAPGEYFSWLSKERSVVLDSKNNPVLEGQVYYVVDGEWYRKLVQVGRVDKKKFELVDYYRQPSKTLPIIKLGGESTSEIVKGEELDYLTSYFSGFVPFANEALRQFSDHQAIMVTAGHPIREMEGAECNQCNGGGWIKQEGDAARVICQECTGSGLRIPVSPYGVLIKRPKGGPLDGTGIETREAMRYISPDVAIVKYSGEHWKELLLLAEKSLNLNYIDEAQSGVAKEIDRENLTAMLDRIGTNIYLNIYRNSVIIVQRLRSRGNKEQVEIIMPNTFKIRSEKDLVDELASLIEKGAAMPLIVEVAKELTKKRYAGDEKVIKAVDVLSEYDPLFALPVERRQEMLAVGAILWQEYRRSLFAYSAITAVMREHEEDFMELDYDKIIELVEAKVAPYLIPQWRSWSGATG